MFSNIRLGMPYHRRTWGLLGSTLEQSCAMFGQSCKNFEDTRVHLGLPKYCEVEIYDFTMLLQVFFAGGMDLDI